jgi:hypothetical protein
MVTVRQRDRWEWLRDDIGSFPAIDNDPVKSFRRKHPLSQSIHIIERLDNRIKSIYPLPWRSSLQSIPLQGK